MADEIGHRIPLLPLLLNTDEPITVTFTRRGGDYPVGATLTVEVGDVDWPAVIVGPTATVSATAVMVDAAAGAGYYRVLLVEGDQTVIAAKGPVIHDA